MLFSSLEFLFLFMLVTIPLYFLCPLRWRNVVLLAVSLIFYGWGEPIYVFLMAFTIAVDYVFGMLVEKYSDNPKKKKLMLILAIVINLGILGFFKYADFVINNIRLIPGLGFIKPMGLGLPIGISFYTFQALSYVIDIYRADAKAQKNIVNFGAYVTLFPQLIAGPIVRYKDVDDQLTCREHSIALAASGVRTFIAGLCKKVLLANVAGELWRSYSMLPDGELSVLGSWFGIICYSFQLYFDFSGYSDMAIGLGKIFGFRFLENFDYPYIAKSITDFWRRWHISLSSWFREYVYIPLGGNRCGVARTYINLFCVWLLTGIWHGANWNFILWGVYYAVLLIIEKAFLGKLIAKLPAVFGHIYALFFIIIGWLIFVFDASEAHLTLGEGIRYLGTMFGAGGAPLITSADVWDLVRSGVLMFIMVFAALPVGRRAFWNAYEKRKWMHYASSVGCVVMLLVCIAYLVDSTFNPFLYFRF